MSATRARRPWASRLLLFLGVLLVGAEVAVRLDDWRAGRDRDFYLPPNLFEEGVYLPHPYLGVVLKPGYERAGEYSFHINSLGMRSAEMSAQKPPGTYRILCLGGSTTYGTGATSNASTYPAQMERLLNELAAVGRAPPGIRYEVGNCGVSGWSSVESLINLELRLVDYEPDAILIYDGINDGKLIQSRSFLPDYSHMRCALSIETLSPLESFLVGNVRLYARLTRGIDPEAQLGTLGAYLFVPGANKQAVPSDVWLNEEGLQVLQRNEASIFAIARRHGILPVLSTIVVREPTGHSLAAYVPRANEALRELARRKNVPLLDVEAVICNQPELFDDYVHLNDLGELRHAEVVVDEALQLGLFGLR